MKTTMATEHVYFNSGRWWRQAAPPSLPDSTNYPRTSPGGILLLHYGCVVYRKTPAHFSPGKLRLHGPICTAYCTNTAPNKLCGLGTLGPPARLSTCTQFYAPLVSDLHHTRCTQLQAAMYQNHSVESLYAGDNYDHEQS